MAEENNHAIDRTKARNGRSEHLPPADLAVKVPPQPKQKLQFRTRGTGILSSSYSGFPEQADATGTMGSWLSACLHATFYCAVSTPAEPPLLERPKTDDTREIELPALDSGAGWNNSQSPRSAVRICIRVPSVRPN